MQEVIRDLSVGGKRLFNSTLVHTTQYVNLKKDER